MKKLFSVKMRASKYDDNSKTIKHISGAEKIIEYSSLKKTTKNLIYRALEHERGQAKKINITIERLEQSNIVNISCLDIFNVESRYIKESHKRVIELLKTVDIDKKKGEQIISMLNNISNMRGAVLLDISNMKRLEPNKERGIRATNFDWDGDLVPKLKAKLKLYQMDHKNVIEALALASKVIYSDCILGEICISDDPSYTTGYVSIRGRGYFRIENLKEMGSPSGVRIILFNGSVEEKDEYISFLENTVTLISSLPNINIEEE